MVVVEILPPPFNFSPLPLIDDDEAYETDCCGYRIHFRHILCKCELRPVEKDGRQIERVCLQKPPMIIS